MTPDAVDVITFATDVGQCALAWSGDEIVGVQLPEATDAAFQRRMRRRWPDAVASVPPPAIGAVIDAIVTLLSGARGEERGRAAAVIAAAPLCVNDTSEFDRRVYDVVRAIGPGSTMTYGDVADALAEPGAARAVGQAMGANPYPIIVPCHRVIAAHGKLGGFSANGGSTTKARLLEIEGAPVTIAPTLFD